MRLPRHCPIDLSEVGKSEETENSLLRIYRRPEQKAKLRTFYIQLNEAKVTPTQHIAVSLSAGRSGRSSSPDIGCITCPP